MVPIEIAWTVVQQVESNVKGLQSSVALLQVQVANLQYSKLSRKELVSRKQELQQFKTTIVATPKETPNYWTTSFELIALLSQAQAQLESTERKPVTVIDDVRYANVPGILAFVVKDKNVLLKNHIEGVHFENSVIHFDPSVRLVNTTFVNCVFIFPTSPNPSENLQKIGETLLASDLQNVKVNGG